MAFCPNCYSSAANVSRVSIAASEIGLPSGTIHGVEKVECPECGEETISVPAHGAVIKEFRKQLAMLSRPLAGAEFAYLRRTLGVSGKGYAQALGVTNVTISRLENAETVPAVQDTLIRALTVLDVESPGAMDRLVARSADSVSVFVEEIEKSKKMDVLGGWKPIQGMPQFVGSVTSLSGRVHREVDDFAFEEASNELYYEPRKRRA